MLITGVSGLLGNNLGYYFKDKFDIRWGKIEFDMFYFAAIAAVLLAWSGTLVEHSDWVIALAFLIGAFLSAFAGWIGLFVCARTGFFG